jgi:hypothetical protein
MPNIFTPINPRPDLTTPGGQATFAVQQIDQQVRNAASTLNNAYTMIRKIVYANQFKLTSDALYAAFDAQTTTGFSSAQLQQFASIIKAVVNTAVAGTITDDVPQATISLPTDSVKKPAAPVATK